MHIEFPLLSILSVGLLLFFALQGGDVELYSWEVGFSVFPDEVRVTVDPVFLVWNTADTPLSAWALKGKYGFTLGNVITFRNNYRNHALISLALQHEAIHVCQQRALGLWTPLGYLFGLNIEGEPYYSIAPDFKKNLIAMWKPPISWINQWSFISISFVEFQPVVLILVLR